jgi:hypothetical protein
MKWSLTIDRYLREGRTVSGGCGATGAQEQLQTAQMNFYNTMTAEQSSTFASNQAILSALTKSFQPILEAGISQQGFSPAELQNMESEATTGSGQAYANASKALAAQQGDEGGGTTYIPSGAKMEQQEQLATSAAQNLATEQSNITAADYATGRQNYLEAANVLGGVAAGYNPTGYAGQATGAGSAASTTANEIASENSSWMNLAAGALGAAGTAFKGAGTQALFPTSSSTNS